MENCSKSYPILIDPHDYFEEYHSALHGITAETVRNQPRFADLIDDIDHLVSDLPVIHHTHFDRVAIRQACAASGVALREWRWLDSAKVARRVWPDVAEGAMAWPHSPSVWASLSGITTRRRRFCRRIGNVPRTSG
jgi:DNA polymerase-3 subunit epsilon